MYSGTIASTTASCLADNNETKGNSSGEEYAPNSAMVDPGAMQARFINQYDPLYDKPYVKYELNTGRYLDRDLSALLEDDRRANVKHHLTTDKVQKAGEINKGGRMTKRRRSADEECAVRLAVELICQRPATTEEIRAVTLTPLEKQVVHLKESVPRDVVLMVACGYRVKFYGRDSRVASRRLGIMCIPTTPFESSSVPYTRVNLYVHRLVAMGYRVAFADQENASIRATSGNAKGIFTREISRVYSRGTLLPHEVIGGAGPLLLPAAATTVDQHDATEGEGGVEEGEGEMPASDMCVPVKMESSLELFMCFVKPPSKMQENAVLEMNLVSFVTYALCRYRIASEAELLDVLHRHDIVEVILMYERGGCAAEGDDSFLLSPLRGLPEAYATSLATVLSLHFGPTTNGEEDGKSVSVCVAEFAGSMDESIAKHLVSHQLDGVYTKMCSSDGKPQPLGDAIESAEERMELPGTTLSALDIFYSSIGTKGCLFSLLDHSLTVLGVRRLRAWLTLPPCDLSIIMARQEAVAFMLGSDDDGGSGGNAVTNMLRECAKFGDIEATVGKLHAQRCSVTEYLYLLQAVKTTCTLSEAILSSCGNSVRGLIRKILLRVSSADMSAFLESWKPELESKATVSSPLEYFTALGIPLPTDMQIHMRAQDEAMRALDEELDSIRQTLQMPALEYRTIAGTSFIIDVPQAKCHRALKDWLVLSRTKSHVRYQTSRVVELNIALCSARERLAIEANNAWQVKQRLLTSSAATLRVFQDVIDAVAVLDALRCLAVTSSAPGYVSPILSDDAQQLVIVGGRHPVLDKIMRDGYVGCDVQLVKGGAWILTGPNMGGKSALMRMVGIFSVMAQLGCYVPATSALMPVFSAVYCRMGASDSLLEGTSTFLKEMEETSRILRSPRVSSSLVLLDEVGRGTSSFDGIAVAAATLEYLLHREATTFFVTHYSHLCEPYVMGGGGNGKVACYFMGFREESGDGKGGEPNIVFTYKPTPGVTPSSFGVRVARMAGLPPAVVAEAQRLSEEEEREYAGRGALMQVRRFLKSSLVNGSCGA